MLLLLEYEQFGFLHLISFQRELLRIWVVQPSMELLRPVCCSAVAPAIRTATAAEVE